MKLIVGITGASGVNYTFSLLRALKEKKVEVHLVISEWAQEVLKEETGKKRKDLEKLATKTYSNTDLSASISSSSFLVDGMIIIPSSIKTVSEIKCDRCRRKTHLAINCHAKTFSNGKKINSNFYKIK